MCSPRHRGSRRSSLQRLAAGEEAHACRVRIGGEVAGEDDVGIETAGELLEDTRRRDRLQLALALELQLPVRHVVRKQQGSVRLWCQDLGY